MHLRVAIAVGQGTGPELADIFEKVLRTLGQQCESLTLECPRPSRVYHSYSSLLAVEGGEVCRALETDRDADHYQDFCQSETEKGTKVVFRTAVSAQALYIVRERLSAVKVERFDIKSTGGSLLLIRDQSQGFYSGSTSSPNGKNNMIERVCSFSKAIFERILEYALLRANLEWGQPPDQVFLVYKFHLFDGLFAAWAEEWRQRFGIDIAFIQPDTMNRNILASGIKSNCLLVASNEYADIMEVIFISWFGQNFLRVQEASFAENVYLAQPISGLSEFQTVHGSADDLTGRNIVNPTATVRAAATILERWGRCEGLVQRVDDVLTQLIKDKTVTADQGGSTSTADFVELILSHFDAKASCNGTASEETSLKKPPQLSGGSMADLKTRPDFEHPLLSKQSALIIVDLQNDFVSSKQTHTTKDLVENVSRLVQFARSRNVEVIFLRFIGDERYQTAAWRSRNQRQGRSSICLENTWGAEIVDRVRPRETERVFDKKGLYDPFMVPDFDRYISKIGVEHVLLAGLYSDVCVDATARGAFQRGLFVTVIKDATAPFYTSDPERAEQYMAEAYGARILSLSELSAMSAQEAKGADLSKNVRVWYKEDIGARLAPSTRRVYKEWAGLEGDELIQHLHGIRQEAWSAYAYPCVGQWTFLLAGLAQQPWFSEVVSELKGQLGKGKILDVGTFLGQDLRLFAAEGISTQRMIGLDVDQKAWDLGLKLFGDKTKFEGQFMQADFLQDTEEESARYSLPACTHSTTLSSWLAEKRSLPSCEQPMNSAPRPKKEVYEPLYQSCDLIVASQFIHLFSLPQQTVICIRLVEFSHVGTMIIGHQAGRRTPSTSVRPWGVMYYHDEETWREMWDVVQLITGTKWDLTVVSTLFHDWFAESADSAWMAPDQIALDFRCRRIE